jgi:excinuclease ABC subunit A
MEPRIKQKAKSQKRRKQLTESCEADLRIVRIVIDRVTKNEEDETISRLGDRIQTAFFEGKGDCLCALPYKYLPAKI